MDCILVNMNKKVEKRLLLLLLIISGVVASYYLLTHWLVAAIFSPMLFSGGEDLHTLFLVIMAISMPFLIVIFQIVQLIAYIRDKRILQIYSALFLLLSPLMLLFYN